jgi:hypothetical protein
MPRWKAGEATQHPRGTERGASACCLRAREGSASGGLNGARAVLARGAARGVDVERLLLGIACGRSGARGQLGPRTEAGSEGVIGGGPRLLIRRSLTTGAGDGEFFPARNNGLGSGSGVGR